MKIKILLLVSVFYVSVNYAQSNKEIANVYLKRAREAIESSINYTSAQEYFEKAMKYTDTILDRKVAMLGSNIYFEIHQKQKTLKEQLNYLDIAEKYSKQYFNLARNNSSEEYTIATEEYVLILEKKEEITEKINKIELEELKKKQELKKIDSLKTVWENKSQTLTIVADSIYNFNKNKVALFKNKGLYGIINDIGNILVPANEYADVVFYDEYFVFKNKEKEPTKLFCFNSNTNSGFLIPSISDFNTISTHYGQVMLPRGNGRLITYPNNSSKVFVFDLLSRKTVKVANEEEVFKNLKRADVIDKYNNDGEIKIEKEWYKFGGHLGGGIHPLYANEGYDLKGFLCAIDGKFLSSISDYQFIGAFYDGKFEAIKGSELLWINQNGTKVSEGSSSSGRGYTGESIIIKLDSKKYQIVKEGFIILGNEKLEKLSDFLRKYSEKE